MSERVDENYRIAEEYYNTIGVNVEKTIKRLADIPLSIHCWQGDDGGGHETSDAVLSGGGIQLIGNYVGKTRTAI